MARDYHHGDLPSALRAAAVELIAERGPAAFSLREVARRAGVSHAAPAHHFGDARGLLSSVAAEGFSLMANAMSAATTGVEDPGERLTALGLAYVETAQANPGHYALMITHEFTDREDEELLNASLSSYVVLTETVEFLKEKLNPDLDIDATATLLWSSVHGLVELAPILDHVAETTEADPIPIADMVRHLTTLTLSGISR